MKSEIKTAAIFGVVIVGIVASLGLAFTFLESNSASEVNENKVSLSDVDMKIDKSKFKKVPDLVGIAHYINTTPEQLTKEMEGKIVLYDIWT